MKNYAIAIHAGAETVKRANVSKEKEQKYREGLEEALKAGTAVLEKGGSALDAVTAAVVAMENNPHFNAGKGASLNIHGEATFDAAIMDGKNLRSGSVGNVPYVKNPIKLARVVMEKCKHTFLVGTGATEYALQHNLELEEPSYFITEEKLKEWRESDPSKLLNQHDTVGAVALDQEGNIAAATSTGGLDGQLKGRVSDSPVIGGGTYANNPYCAVSCTGKGEVIMRGVMAHEVYAMVKYASEGLQSASDKAIKMYDAYLKGDKGLVALNQKGEVAFGFNTNMMKRGYSIGGASPAVAIWDNEKI
jgi:beta-aspartyl-peptidase (threonine type)